MAHLGSFRQWSLDHKLAFWSIVVSAVIAIAAGIVIPLTVSGSSGSKTDVGNVNGTNYGTINNSVNQGTVNNYYGVSATPTTCQANAGNTTAGRSKDSVAVDLFVRPAVRGACWERAAAHDGSPSVVQFEVAYQNTSRVWQRDVEVRLKLAVGITMVPHSTYLANDTNPNGTIVRTDAASSNGWGVLEILDRDSRLRGSVHASSASEVQPAVQG